MLNQPSKEDLTRWARELTHRAQALAARLPRHPLPLDVKVEIEQATRWLTMQRVKDRPQILEIAEMVMRMADLRLTWIEQTLGRIEGNAGGSGGRAA
jgi:hypothetical protein